jgi:RNA-directed DNA polymerase
MQTRRTAENMQTSLRGIAERARRDKKARFRNLYGMLTVANLRWCYCQLNKKAAAGVDHVTFKEYERDLEANLTDLVERLKRKQYRAKLVRRKYIRKRNGKRRPLGIPALEDKLLQIAVSKMLVSIYEQDFLDGSWGYRPGRGPREASRRLANDLYRGLYGWVVEADIRGFFDSIDHGWMLRMLEERVDDKALVRLIGKWLKAGVLEEDGKVIHPATGTPQGGIISPVLANIYLHYALDLWFDRIVRKKCQGEVYMMRFADDFVCAFRFRGEAVRFMEALSNRLAKFNLEVAREKTRLVQFSRFNEGKDESFDFLGFEFRWVRRHTGKMGVRRRTSPERLRTSMRAFKEWIKEFRNVRITTLMQVLRRKLLGYWNYYGVRGNMLSLARLFNQCKLLLYKWLNRRSQKKSYTWDGLSAMLRHFAIPTPRIMEKPFGQ